jgi:hypothetical protein
VVVIVVNIIIVNFSSPPKGYRTLTEGALEYEQEEYKKLTPLVNE